MSARPFHDGLEIQMMTTSPRKRHRESPARCARDFARMPDLRELRKRIQNVRRPATRSARRRSLPQAEGSDDSDERLVRQGPSPDRREIRCLPPPDPESHALGPRTRVAICTRGLGGSEPSTDDADNDRRTFVQVAPARSVVLWFRACSCTSRGATCQPECSITDTSVR